MTVMKAKYFIGKNKAPGLKGQLRLTIESVIVHNDQAVLSVLSSWVQEVNIFLSVSPETFYIYPAVQIQYQWNESKWRKKEDGIYGKEMEELKRTKGTSVCSCNSELSSEKSKQIAKNNS